MLLDLWEWFLLINDGIDLVFSNLASGTYPIPLSFILVFILFGLLSFFAWRSTDIPDLPPAPRPPYVIQITAGPGSGGARQTINDVRLLSGGAFFDGSEILSRYHNISRNQATNTDVSNEQASTSSSASGTAASNRNGPAAGTRNSLGETAGQTIRRRIPGRSLLLGLFRRPNQITRPVPAVSNAIRAQLNSPNLVVYHRVNVYHHHIHSHLGQNSGGNNSANRPPYQSQSNPVLSSSPSSSFSVPQSSPSTSTTFNHTSSTLPETSSSGVNEGHRSNQEEQSLNAQDSGSGDSVTDIGGVTDARSSTNSTVHNQAGISQDLANSTANEASSSHLTNDMPARSGGENEQSGGGDHCSHASYSQHGSNPPETERIPGEDDVRFTIKFLNDTQMDVTSQLSEKIVDFKRRHFATEMAENKTVRLIFNGRVLDNDSKTLREFGIFDQCVVHCLIVNRQQHMDPTRNTGGLPTGRNNAGGQADGIPGNVRRVVGLPEPGMFFVAFIGIFLIFLWFICLHFGQHLFTQSAVVSLTVLTAIFLIGIVACYLPLPAN